MKQIPEIGAISHCAPNLIGFEAMVKKSKKRAFFNKAIRLPRKTIQELEL